MIFVLRQIQEKCRGLYAAFVDLTKAFDTISRDGQWKILARLGCPPNFSPSSASSIKVRRSTMGSFPISNGVKQGCILAPTLFSIFFSIMLPEAKEDLADGIYSKQMFNLQHLLTCMKTTEELTHH